MLLFFVLCKYIIQLYCNEFVIQRLAVALYESAAIRKSILYLLAG